MKHLLEKNIFFSFLKLQKSWIHLINFSPIRSFICYVNGDTKSYLNSIEIKKFYKRYNVKHMKKFTSNLFYLE